MKTMDAVMKVVSGLGAMGGAVCFGLLGWWAAVPVAAVGLVQIGRGIAGVIEANV